MKKISVRREPSLDAKLQAFPFQQEAYNKIKDLEYGAIFHEQGLGKTKIAIDILLYWLKNTEIDTILIVTKKQLINNWVDEFKFHTNIKPSILTNDSRNNYFVFNSPARVVLANFEVLPIEKNRFELYLKVRNVAIIIDESAKIKNPESKITKTLFELSSMFKKRIIMTGTPVANRPYDIWSQIFFLDNGQSLGADFKEFKRTSDLANDLYKKSGKREELETFLATIHENIKDFSVRETKQSGVIDLPNKTYFDIPAVFEKQQETMYEECRSGIALLVEKNEQTVLDDSESILKKLLRLVQIASNPKLIDDAYWGNSGKEIVLNDLLEKIIKRNEKCIVWSAFQGNVDIFAEKYKDYGTTKIHGKLNMHQRNNAVKRFKNDPECKILFATPQSAKEGLTLTVANNVIFYDRSFSLDDYIQAQDRIHRISQSKGCNIYNIIMKDSIDEWVKKLLDAKKIAAELVQGDITFKDYHKSIDYSFGQIVKRILNLD